MKDDCNNTMNTHDSNNRMNILIRFYKSLLLHSVFHKNQNNEETTNILHL